jgi:hypothetical protein
MNAAWLIRTGTQILPMEQPLVRDDQHHDRVAQPAEQPVRRGPARPQRCIALFSIVANPPVPGMARRFRVGLFVVCRQFDGDCR